jgi:hypothetical protein
VLGPPECGWAVVAMTQQYIIGELSVLLARLQAVAADEASAGAVARLRHAAEVSPSWALPGVEARALELTDGLCWASLTRGDRTAFDQQAVVAAQLLEFGVCAGLVSDG